MAVPAFEFTTPLGHRDVNHFLQNPPNEDAARDYMNELPFDIRTYLNNVVKAQLDDYNSHKIGIAPHAESTNRTVTVGAGKDFTTIQAAINSVKKNLRANITITVDAGTYAETVNVSGFIGEGSLTINGAAGLADTHIVNGFEINRNTAKITLTGFKTVSSTVHALTILSCTDVAINYLKSDVSATSTGGIRVKGGSARIDGCLMSNRLYALAAEESTVASCNWTVGTGNVIGLVANYAATIGKTSTQPQGTTAENVLGGGAIR